MPLVRPSYNSFEKRIRSFSKVNIQSRYAKLAAAGFWYNSRQKCMECYFCPAQAFNFLTCNDPDVFHAKRSPDCMFMRRKLGDEWIHNAVNNYCRDYEEELFICKICCTRKIFCTFQPCGHAVCGNACFFPLEKCPYCNRHIRSYQRFYY